MYAESGKRLRRSLTETNITYARGLGSVEDVVDSIRNVVPCKIIDTVVPEFRRIWPMMDRFLGVLVPAIVPEPNIKTSSFVKLCTIGKRRKITCLVQQAQRVCFARRRSDTPKPRCS